MQNSISNFAKPCFFAGLLAISGFVACSGDDDDSAGSGGKTSQASGGEAGNAGGESGQTPQAGQTSQAGNAAAGAAGVEPSIARGDYLVNHVAACGDCHTPRGATGAPVAGKLLAGNAAFADLAPADPDTGLLPTPNLTPDKTTGLGNWTDEQIKNAFLNGLDDDDQPLFSVMPYYVFHNMSDSDADSIVLYLRSIPAVKNVIPERQDFPFPVTQAKPVPLSALPSTTLKATDAKYASAQNGKYLAANVGICLECHTEHDPTGMVPLLTDKLFQGNETFTREQLGLPPVFPENIVSSNLTPGKNGLKGWTAEDVVKVLKQGVDKDGNPLCPPMPYGPLGAFGGLTDSDALDIGNYLTTLAPADSDVIPLCVAPGAPGAGGAGAGGMSGAGGAGGAP